MSAPLESVRLIAVCKELVYRSWHSGTLWSVLQVLSKAGFGVLVVPLMAKKLTASDLGLWYTFAALGSFGAISDFGLTIVFSRVFGIFNAKVDRVSGSELSEVVDGIDEGSLYHTAHRSFSIAGLFTFIALGIGGTIYLRLLLNISNFETVCWLMYCLAWSFSAAGNFWIAYSNGLDEIAISSRAAVYATVLGLIATWLILRVSSSVLAPVLGFGIVNIATRLQLIARYTRAFARHGKGNFSIELIRRLLPVGWRQGLAALSGFFVYQASLLVVSAKIGREEAASFGMSLQVVLVLSGLCLSFVNAKVPTLISLRARSKTSEVLQLSIVTIRRALWAFLACQLFLMVGHQYIVDLLHLKTALLQEPYLMIMLTSQMLELFHVACAVVYGTTNRVRWVWVSVTAGFVLVFSHYYASSLAGVLGVLISQLLVQLLFNNWWPPMFLAKNLGLNSRDLLFATVVPTLVAWLIFCALRISYSIEAFGFNPNPTRSSQPTVLGMQSVEIVSHKSSKHESEGDGRLVISSM
jgi:O-antigen/teichoic acid export membrane protein